MENQQHSPGSLGVFFSQGFKFECDRKLSRYFSKTGKRHFLVEPPSLGSLVGIISQFAELDPNKTLLIGEELIDVGDLSTRKLIVCSNIISRAWLGARVMIPFATPLASIYFFFRTSTKRKLELVWAIRGVCNLPAYYSALRLFAAKS